MGVFQNQICGIREDRDYCLGRLIENRCADENSLYNLEHGQQKYQHETPGGKVDLDSGALGKLPQKLTNCILGFKDYYYLLYMAL